MVRLQVYMEDSDKNLLDRWAKKNCRTASKQAIHYIKEGIKREEENAGSNNENE